MVRAYDKGTADHLIDADDPAHVALCGRPGPWSPPPDPKPGEPVRKHCADCATSHQVRTNHRAGRVWTAR